MTGNGRGGGGFLKIFIMFSGIFMFLGVGGLVALITALIEFTFSFLAQVNTNLILNYSS